MLRRFSIKHRLQVSFATVLLILLLVSAAGLWAVRTIQDTLRMVYEERAVPAQLVSQANSLMQRNRVLVMDMLINPGNANIEKRLSEFERNVQQTEQVLARFAAVPRPAALEPLYQRLQETHTGYLQEGLVKASQAMARNDFDEAQFLYLNKVSPLAPPFQAAMGELAEAQLTRASQDYEGARRLAQTAWVTVSAMLGIGLTLGLLLAWAVARSITQPIGRAEQLAEQVAQGNLAKLNLPGGHDEMARLTDKLDTMRVRLARIVREVREGADQIATGSGEISQGVNDLSQRTELQAANLQEASASLDNLLQGTQTHADISERASSIARVARDSAQAGGSAVNRLIEQIGKVNERSQRITEITAVIDSIAFQTNILALNAAVEAARAGEQGRGFAVVAQEVRVLAQRSAAAASEIKTLIADAVGSVEQVTTMASDTGQTVRGIVKQVREVDDLILQLKQASAEQALQLGHIHEAVRHIDTTTQQNAALVEENAAAALSLSREAAELDTLVSAFHLDATDSPG
jgi:methyl-accepting chemotaxis protein-1 (serine sensor receptor)